jgi:hypothetical protein
MLQCSATFARSWKKRLRMKRLLFGRSLGMSSQQITTSVSREPKDTSAISPEEVQKINRILIVGAGTMGTQIGLQCASHGRLVFLYDNLRAAVQEAPARLERLAQELAAKGFLGSDMLATRCSELSPPTTWPPPHTLPLSSNACRRIWNLKRKFSNN